MVAGALTGFVLILMLGVGLTVMLRSAVAARTLPTTPADVPQIQVEALQIEPTATPISPANHNAPRLAADQAAQIAANLVPNAQLVRTPELVDLQGTVAYEVVLKQGVAYIDANTGAVLFNGANTPQSSARLAADQAAQIAANLVPNAQLVRTPELVDLQGTVAYEVVLKQGAVYIDANTGAVLLNKANTPQSSTRLTPDQAAQIAAKRMPNSCAHLNWWICKVHWHTRSF